MNLFNYSKLKKRYNELLTKYDIADDLPTLIEQRSWLLSENQVLSENLDQKKTLLREYESLEALSEEASSKRKELTLLKEQIEKFQKILGSLENLDKIHQEIEALESRKKLLQSKNVKKYDPSKIIYAIYGGINDNPPYNLAPFIYEGDVKYKSDDGTYICSEYKSLGGSLWFAYGNQHSTIYESEKRLYNSDYKSFVTFEEVCAAIGNKLYLENEVTYDEIMSIMSVFDQYDTSKENLVDIVYKLSERQKDRKKIIKKTVRRA